MSNNIAPALSSALARDDSALHDAEPVVNTTAMTVDVSSHAQAASEKEEPVGGQFTNSSKLAELINTTTSSASIATMVEHQLMANNVNTDKDIVLAAATRPTISRAAFIAKAQNEKQNSTILTEKLPASVRAARAKVQHKQLMVKKAAEKAKAAAEAERQLIEETKARDAVYNELLVALWNWVGVQMVSLREVEASIPPVMLRLLPDEYYKLRDAEKYRECQKVLALLQPVNEVGEFMGESTIIEHAEDKDIVKENAKVEEQAEEQAMEMAGKNGIILEEYVYDTTSSQQSNSLATVIKADSDGNQQYEDSAKMSNKYMED